MKFKMNRQRHIVHYPTTRCLSLILSVVWVLSHPVGYLRLLQTTPSRWITSINFNTMHANGYSTALGSIFPHSFDHVPISQTNILLSMGHYGAFIFRCVSRSRRIDTSSKPLQETSGWLCEHWYWSDWRSGCNRRYQSRWRKSQDSEQETDISWVRRFRSCLFFLVDRLACRQPITALCISLTSSLLLVGTSLGIIFIYDIPSHQLLRTIFSYKDKGLSITYLTTLLKPPDLVGHISLSMSTTGGVVETIPVKPIGSFHRMRDVKTREAHEVPMLLPIQASVCFELEFIRDYWDGPIFRRHRQSYLTLRLPPSFLKTTRSSYNHPRQVAPLPHCNHAWQPSKRR